MASARKNPSSGVCGLRHEAEGRIHERRTDEEGHDGLDPALLRPGGSRHAFLWRLPAFDMHEVAGDGQVHVAGEIEVVDAGPLEDSCLLRAYVRGEEEQPIASVVAGQFGAAAVQLLRDDGSILVAE